MQEYSRFFSGIFRRIEGAGTGNGGHNEKINVLIFFTALMIIVCQPLNIILGLDELTSITYALIGLLMGIYLLSRYRHKYRTATILIGVLNIAYMIANFVFDGGVNGPGLLLIFPGFVLMLAATNRRYHALWLLIYFVLSIGLLLTENRYPGIIEYKYPVTDLRQRNLDFTSTISVSILLIFFITNYLICVSEREKKIAAEKQRVIESQLEKFKEIAWLQSHNVRSHVATIMGLTEVFNTEDYADPANKKVVDGIKTSTKELDDIIREINRITEEAHLDDK